MAMMIKTLGDKIKEMKALRQRIEYLENKAQQDAVDNRFRALTFQIDQTVQAAKLAKGLIDFQLSEASIDRLQQTLNKLRDAVRSGVADKEDVIKAEEDLKELQSIIKKEWSKHYIYTTGTTISTLKVIQGIDSQKVANCLLGISRGEKWTANVSDLKVMSKSLSDANTLIEGLGLDQQIIGFLKKMNSGKATLADVDDKVMDWLRTEALEKRVRISFFTTSQK